MISQETIDAVGRRIEAGEINEQSIVSLREEYPGTHFTWCMEDDIGMEQPVAECHGFNLYLVDGQSHCLKLTTNLAAASGLVIAEVIEE